MVPRICWRIPIICLHGSKKPRICSNNIITLLALLYDITDQLNDAITLLNHAIGCVCYSSAHKIIPWALQEPSWIYKSPCFHYDFPPVIITLQKALQPFRYFITHSNHLDSFVQCSCDWKLPSTSSLPTASPPAALTHVLSPGSTPIIHTSNSLPWSLLRCSLQDPPTAPV